VKQLTELHGGDVRVESGGEGQGAAFTLALPIRALRTGLAAATRAAPEAHALDRIKVLLVEDDPDNREVLRRVLEQHHAVVSAIGSPIEALEMMPTIRPNVLVSDIGLPEMDGYELIRRVRRIGPGLGGGVPAVALTAHASHDDRMQALRAGYQAHIAKPVAPGELVATIASLAGLVSRQA
jgi:CheY-like chemotaxis protein